MSNNGVPYQSRVGDREEHSQHGSIQEVEVHSEQHRHKAAGRSSQQVDLGAQWRLVMYTYKLDAQSTSEGNKKQCKNK